MYMHNLKASFPTLLVGIASTTV